MTDRVTAAVLLVGDEILSGRTQDTNLRTLADFLSAYGIEVREARVVPDVHETIVGAVRALSGAHDYLFTTGGIGPTHDDITADAVAAAFGRSIGVREDARAVLEAWYAPRGVELNEARLRMARIPDGASLIANPVSGAPGFQLENTFVMAGVPGIMKGMLQDVGPRLKTGVKVLSATVKAEGLKEGNISAALGALAAGDAKVKYGSYPWAAGGPAGVSLVARTSDAEALAAAVEALKALIRAEGCEPLVEPA